MGIISYSKLNKRLETTIFESKEISQTNKNTLKRFLITYDVSKARMSIFLKHIIPFLTKFSDVQNVNRDEVNIWFFDYKKKYASATIATYVSVICRFVRWINDGQLPTAFLDMQSIKSSMRRKLKPEDMMLWEDALSLSRLTTSVQLQAVLLSQLDGGFRPGEFIELNYGDVTLVDGMYVCQVQDGKTGARPVVLYRATPYLKTWMEEHPNQTPDAPLWINEKKYIGEGIVEAAKYPALAKRVKTLGRIANIGKPMDFYNLRHSSCAMDKRDNIPPDLAAERHGHSIKYYIEVYGRLDINDTVSRFKSHFGMQSNSQVPSVQSPYTAQQIHLKPSASDAQTKAQTIALQHQIDKLQAQLMSIQ